MGVTLEILVGRAEQVLVSDRATEMPLHASPVALSRWPCALKMSSDELDRSAQLHDLRR
jgi:hypothetical protein